jgi:hypothetical protein
MEKESSQKTGRPLSGLQVWRSHCSCQTRGKGEEIQARYSDGEHDEVVAQEAEEKKCRPVELVKVALTCDALELGVRVKQS